jgi:EpsI family protein
LTAAAFATVAFGFCYSAVLVSVVRTWSTKSVYSYGFAVPLIAAYVFWTKSQGSPRPQVTPDYAFGVPVTLTGLTMLVVGQIGALTTLQQASLIVTPIGLLLLLFGRDVVRSHWFVLAYLLLMIPIWNIPISRLQNPSRILSAKIAVDMLHLVGVPVFRQATNIVLPSHTLAVSLECSGVNQLIALTAMVIPAAYLWLESNVRRIALILFALAISYVGNGVRIALVGWLAANGLGDGNLSGSAHLLQGLVVSALGYLAIGGGFWLLSKGMPTAGQQLNEGICTSPAILSLPSTGRRFWLDVAVLVAMVGAGASRLSATSLDVRLGEDPGSLESRIGDWTNEIGSKRVPVPFPGIDDDLVDVGGYPTPTGERRFIGTDDELVRVYRNSSDERVSLYIAYYHRQGDGKELTGDAGAALAAAASSITLTSESGLLSVNEIVRAKAGERRGVLFWYDINGRIVADFYRLKSYTIWDALTRRRTNGAVVMIGWNDRAGLESESAHQRAIEFAQALLPVLRKHLPS